MKPESIRRLLLSALLLTLFTFDLYAQSNFVYINNNSRNDSDPGTPVGTAHNTVSAFSVGPTGALTPVPGSPFATGGLGNGVSTFSGDRAAICMIGNRLYVANQASNNVSGFDINPTTGVLTLIPGSPFATGGTSSGTGAGMSLERVPNGQFLIATNGFSGDITVFSIAPNGALTPIAGSPFPVLPPPSFGAAGGIKVSPNGQFLAVTLSGTDDQVAMFSIASNGALTPVSGSPFSSPANGFAAGVDINCASNLLFVGEANSSGTNVSVFNIASNGALTSGLAFNNSPPNAGVNSSVVLLSPNEQFLFVSNQNSNTITVFNVAPSGSLSLVSGSPFANPGGNTPMQMVTNAAGTFLYVNNKATNSLMDDGTVSIFSIAANGSLTPVSGSPFAAGSSERPGIAAYPAAAGGGSFTCPNDITVSNDPGQCGATVSFPPISSSGCGVVTCNPPSGSFFPVGTTTVTCSSGSTSCSFKVTVNDVEAPVVSCGVTTPILWSPDKTLVNVGLSASASDNCSDNLTTTISVFSDEDDGGTASEKHSPDAKNIAPGTLLLRAERKGNENGRVFLIVIKTTDSGGNVGLCVQTVVVPHDQSQESLDSVAAQAAAAKAYALANNGNPPPGYFAIGVGPVIGPNQ
jgi:6-phosphogluconolactonase (cycloisomerase 2 family)